MKRQISLCIAVLFFCSNYTLAAALVGTDVEYGKLVRIDTSTGATTVIGTFGVNNTVASIAYDWNHNILYGSCTSTDNLLTIDIATGQATTIGPLGVGLMHGLEYDSINGTLYGITNQGSTKSLYTINVQTGAATLVGYHGQNGLSGLAFDSVNGVMYASDMFSKQLYTINLSNGAATLIGSFGAGMQLGTGLAYDTHEGLFACDNFASEYRDDTLYKINPQTGAATLIGPTNTGNLLGLTFVPEPCTLLLLGLGAVVLRKKAKKAGE